MKMNLQVLVDKQAFEQYCEENNLNPTDDMIKLKYVREFNMDEFSEEELEAIDKILMGDIPFETITAKVENEVVSIQYLAKAFDLLGFGEKIDLTELDETEQAILTMMLLKTVSEEMLTIYETAKRAIKVIKENRQND